MEHQKVVSTEIPRVLLIHVTFGVPVGNMLAECT